jgi:hypothetical protein
LSLDNEITPGMPVNQKKAEEIKRQFESEWLRLKGVTAVGIGYINNSVGIIISVESLASKVKAQIPSEIDGVQIKVEPTGTLRA